MPEPRLPDQHPNTDPADEIRRRLLHWFARFGRSLPWRAPPGAARDPWRVLVSEVMLQQTTAQVVAERFESFMARFPTPTAMAEASLEAVLHAWQGLGYYSRARALHRAAGLIVRRHGGRVPQEEACLRALPGIGPYTARAVAALAFGRAVIPVDAHVERVLARLFALEMPRSRLQRQLEPLLGALAEGHAGGPLAEALMDLGAAVCRPARPLCSRCPLADLCRARATGRETALPLPSPKRAREKRRQAVFLLTRGDGAVLLRRRPPRGLLGGLLELPQVDLPAGQERACPPAGLPRDGWRRLPGRVRHLFTHIELECVVHVRRLREGEEAREAPDRLWCRPEGLARYPLSSLVRKLLAHAGVSVPASGRQASGR